MYIARRPKNQAIAFKSYSSIKAFNEKYKPAQFRSDRHAQVLSKSYPNFNEHFIAFKRKSDILTANFTYYKWNGEQLIKISEWDDYVMPMGRHTCGM
jgi:hypothetical protein|tara:strand:- start:289 stop:579 length:291 start_codon:yes stop_codon:yes gene_type:complete